MKKIILSAAYIISISLSAMQERYDAENIAITHKQQVLLGLESFKSEKGIVGSDLGAVIPPQQEITSFFKIDTDYIENSVEDVRKIYQKLLDNNFISTIGYLNVQNIIHNKQHKLSLKKIKNKVIEYLRMMGIEPYNNDEIKNFNIVIWNPNRKDIKFDLKYGFLMRDKKHLAPINKLNKNIKYKI